MYLTYRNHSKTRFLQCVQNRLSRWFQRIIVTVGCPAEFSFPFPHVRPCDYPSHFPFIFHCNFPGDLTAPVQFLQAKCLLVSRNLQYGIRRRIDNHMPGGNLFFSKFIQNPGTAGAFISDNHTPGPCREFLQ